MKVYCIPFVMHGAAEVEAPSVREAYRIFDEMNEIELIGFVKVIDYDDEVDLYDEE